MLHRENLENVLRDNGLDPARIGEAELDAMNRAWHRLDPWPELLARGTLTANRRVYTAMWGPTDFVATGATRDFERADDLHRLTMPVLYLTGRHDADLGVMISASHNPMPDNGIKLFSRGGHKLPDAL